MAAPLYSLKKSRGDGLGGRVAEQIEDTIERIADQIRVCPLCELARTRTNAVPGAGDINARIMLIGEGPGWQEDKEGLPFVGASGKFLTELIASAGLTRDEVFITNIVKCRPAG